MATRYGGAGDATDATTCSRKASSETSVARTASTAVPWQRATAATSSIVIPSSSTSLAGLQQLPSSISSENHRHPPFHRWFGSMFIALSTIASVVSPHDGGDACVMNCSDSGK